MRMDVSFSRPLGGDERVRFLLAIACLAKSRSVRFVEGGFRAVVIGESMGLRRVGEALGAASIPVASVTSSLGAEENDSVDVSAEEEVKGPERFRPIGR